MEWDAAVMPLAAGTVGTGCDDIHADFLDALLDNGGHDLTSEANENVATPLAHLWWNECDAVLRENVKQPELASASWERQSSQQGAGTSTGQWRCIVLTHNSACRSCKPAPAPEAECKVELVGDPGKRNGEKKLRSAIAQTPEWGDPEECSRLAAAAEARGDPDSLRLAAAVRAHRVGDLRKSQMLALCREWRYRSDLWVPRGFRRRPPPPATAATAATAAAAAVAAAPAAAGRVDAVAVRGGYPQLQESAATGSLPFSGQQRQLVLAPTTRAGGLFSFPLNVYQPTAPAAPQNLAFGDHTYPRLAAAPPRLSLRSGIFTPLDPATLFSILPQLHAVVDSTVRLFSSKLSARVAAAARSPSSALMTRLLAEAEGGVRGDEYTLRLAGEAVRATQRGLIGNGGSGGAGGGEDGDDEDCAMFAYGEGPLPVEHLFWAIASLLAAAKEGRMSSRITRAIIIAQGGVPAGEAPAAEVAAVGEEAPDPDYSEAVQSAIALIRDIQLLHSQARLGPVGDYVMVVEQLAGLCATFSSRTTDLFRASANELKACGAQSELFPANSPHTAISAAIHEIFVPSSAEMTLLANWSAAAVQA